MKGDSSRCMGTACKLRRFQKSTLIWWLVTMPWYFEIVENYGCCLSVVCMTNVAAAVAFCETSVLLVSVNDSTILWGWVLAVGEMQGSRSVTWKEVWYLHRHAYIHPCSLHDDISWLATCFVRSKVLTTKTQTSDIYVYIYICTYKTAMTILLTFGRLEGQWEFVEGSEVIQSRRDFSTLNMSVVWTGNFDVFWPSCCGWSREYLRKHTR